MSGNVLGPVSVIRDIPALQRHLKKSRAGGSTQQLFSATLSLIKLDAFHSPVRELGSTVNLHKHLKPSRDNQIAKPHVNDRPVEHEPAHRTEAELEKEVLRFDIPNVFRSSTRRTPSIRSFKYDPGAV